MDLESGLIMVKTLDTKMKIVFHPDRKDIARFNKNWPAPVTFDCGQKSKAKCDLSKPYKLYISNVLVEPVEISQ